MKLEESTLFKNPVGAGYWGPGSFRDLTDEQLTAFGKTLDDEKINRVVESLSEAAGVLATIHAYLREIRARSQGRTTAAPDLSCLGPVPSLRSSPQEGDNGSPSFREDA